MHGTMANETVLIVDDEDLVRQTLEQILAVAGFGVVTARNGSEALERLESGAVSLVVSDISMPVMDGNALYERVRARPEWLAIPFVFLTAHGEPPRVRSARELGVDDYLVKPVASEDLVATVRGLLRRSTQLERARVAQIERVKDAILMVLGHELRTPLTMVSGYAELLQSSLPPGEAQLLRQALGGILKGAARLRRLAEDLVILVELRSGDATRHFHERRRRVTDLRELLREELATRSADAELRHVKLEDLLPGQLPAVVGDGELLAGAVGRLLDNGIKFSPRTGGRVAVKGRSESGRLFVEVEDEGEGIPAGELARLTELFYQVDRKKNEQQGTGTGLAIVHAIVQMHAGELTVRSELGKGSTFGVSLPLADETSGQA
jgi:signal transduction histidine kinase